MCWSSPGHAGEPSQSGCLPLEIVGEAAQNIRRNYPDFATHHPELPWSSAAAMRNALTHGYFDVDLKIVWKTVIQDVPRLSATVRSMLSGVG
jgi:uncharacterized protein with HEPN domain